MTENQAKLLTDAQTYVTELFQTKVNKSIHFHTLYHTQDVVKGATIMAEHYHLVDDERLALLLAAWFHDTGFSSGKAKDHESVSIRLATEFLLQHNCEQPFVEKVVSCINATRLPQTPATHIEQIICDADLFHLGSDDFKEKNRLLREELNDFGKMDLSKKEWRKKNISFLENHHYFTTYAKEKLEPTKEKYLAELKAKKMGEPKNSKKETGKAHLPVLDEQNKAEEKKKKEKESQTDRGISTVFRIMASNQSNLSHMADNKANIMISVNSIILSVVVSFLGKELDTNYYLIYPIIVIVATGVLTIVFSVLATRPNVTSGTFTKDDIENKKTNLLFFGNFHKMNLADYDWGMTEMLNDKNYLYSSMIKDNYFLGIVLAKKYKYLRISYNIFMYGILISMVAFAIVYSTSGKVVYTPG